MFIYDSLKQNFRGFGKQSKDLRPQTKNPVRIIRDSECYFRIPFNFFETISFPKSVFFLFFSLCFKDCERKPSTQYR